MSKSSTNVNNDRETNSLNEARAGKKIIEKPNLKAAGLNNRNSRIVILLMGCGLICMYPLVFRPMLFSEELGEIQSKKMSEAKINLDRMRPTNMPEWTNPFDSSPKPPKAR